MMLMSKCQYSNLCLTLGFGINLIEELHDADSDEQLQGMDCTMASKSFHFC
jgi:hypothetical protein